jgi:hypothetical protein
VDYGEKSLRQLPVQATPGREDVVELGSISRPQRIFCLTLGLTGSNLAVVIQVTNSGHE